MVRRIARGVLGTALCWGAVWSLVSIPGLTAILRSDSGIPGPPMIQSIWSWGTHIWTVAFAQGAIVGAGFAVLLFLASRLRRGVRPLSYRRLGVVGAIAPAAIGLVVIGPSIGVVGGLILAGLGASTAMLLLAVARRAPGDTLVSEIEQSHTIQRFPNSTSIG